MNTIEKFGEDYCFGIKDNQYFLITRDYEYVDKCYYIERINFNNLEMARKLVSIFEFLHDIDSFRRTISLQNS